MLFVDFFFDFILAKQVALFLAVGFAFQKALCTLSLLLK